MSYRLGIVTARDTGGCRVRVRFDDRDRVESWWLEVVQPKTKDDRVYWVPDLGEQVACLMDARDEAGCVLGAVYSEADPPALDDGDVRAVHHKDGTVERYDRAGHVWELDATAAGTVRVVTGQSVLELTDGGITLTCGAATVSLLPDRIDIAAPAITASGDGAQVDVAGGTVTLEGDTVLAADGTPEPVARIGDQTSDGATIVTGSGKVSSG